MEAAPGFERAPLGPCPASYYIAADYGPPAPAVLYLAAAVLLSLLGVAVAERLVYRDRVLPGVRLARV